MWSRCKRTRRARDARAVARGESRAAVTGRLASFVARLAAEWCAQHLSGSARISHIRYRSCRCLDKWVRCAAWGADDSTADSTGSSLAATTCADGVRRGSDSPRCDHGGIRLPESRTMGRPARRVPRPTRRSLEAWSVPRAIRSCFVRAARVLGQKKRARRWLRALSLPRTQVGECCCCYDAGRSWITSSTRRFCWRPAASLLLATG